MEFSRAIVALLTASTATLLASAGCDSEGPESSARGDADKGKALVQHVGCGSCHRIPGIASARGEVGPPLDQLRKRAYIAGVLPNTFDNMVLWVAKPQTVAPGSAMPDVGLTDAEAEDVAAYLYTLE